MGADIFTDHPVEIQLIWTKVDLGPEEGPDVAVLDEMGFVAATLTWPLVAKDAWLRFCFSWNRAIDCESTASANGIACELRIPDSQVGWCFAPWSEQFGNRRGGIGRDFREQFGNTWEQKVVVIHRIRTASESLEYTQSIK